MTDTSNHGAASHASIEPTTPTKLKLRRLRDIRACAVRDGRNCFALSFNLTRARLLQLDARARNSDYNLSDAPRTPDSVESRDDPFLDAATSPRTDYSGGSRKRKRKRSDTMDTVVSPFVDTAPVAAEATHRPLPRVGFVTVGATAPFRPLLYELLRPDFLVWMRAYGFTHMAVQCGADEAWFRARVAALGGDYNLKIDCFGYTTRMQDYILPCRPVSGVCNAGIVICHAGSGTVVDVSRYGVPFVVVPNESLMDNHQAELADYLEGERWAVAAKPNALPQAIRRAHEQAYAAGLTPFPIDMQAEIEDDEFPSPVDKRVALLDWMARSSYPESPLRSVGVTTAAASSPSSQQTTVLRNPHGRIAVDVDM